MKFPQEFLEILERSGHPLKAIGISETAVSRGEALRAVKALAGSPVAILGGDVYRMQGDKISPTRDSWYVDQRDNSEPESDYIRRTQEAARIFLETYPDPRDSSALSAVGARGVYIEKFPTDASATDSSPLFTLVIKLLNKNNR